MSATLSEATGRPSGSRSGGSALYARQTREQQRHKGEEPARRGDAHGVGRDAAGGDSGRSRPLAVQGEGHRKVRGCWTPGRADAGAAGERAHKCSPRTAAARAPRGCMPGRSSRRRRSPGVRCDGWGVFTAVEHWNGSVWDGTCARLGAVCGARADRPGARRMAPSTPTALEGWRCGWTAASTCPTTLNQIRYWGIRPSYGFVEEPRTAWRSGGIARSRSKRWGIQNLKEVRAAVTAFVERYNTTWPRSSGITRRSRPARRTSYTPGGVALTCVQRTGCGTLAGLKACATKSTRVGSELGPGRQGEHRIGGCRIPHEASTVARRVAVPVQ